MKYVSLVIVAAVLLAMCGCGTDPVEPSPGQPRQFLHGPVTDACTDEPIAGVLLEISNHSTRDSVWTDAKGEYQLPHITPDSVYWVRYTKSGYADYLRRFLTGPDSQKVGVREQLFPLKACLTGIWVPDSTTRRRDIITLDYSAYAGKYAGIIHRRYQTLVDANGHFRFDSLPATPTVIIRGGARIWERDSILRSADTVVQLRYNECVDVTLSPPPRPTQHSDFPSTIGMWWQYAVSHTPHGPFDDTVAVSIVDTTRMGDGRKATVWVEQDHNRIDTSYVVDDHGTIKFFSSQANGYVEAEYPNRFKLGYLWSRPDNCYDTTRIVDIASITVPYSYFGTTYHLLRTWGIGCADNSGAVNVWLAPGLGIIKMDVRRITFTGLRVERRELIGFHGYD